MSEQNVLMDYGEVNQAATTFDTSADGFNALIAPLEAVAQSLASSAFLGLTGTAAAQQLQVIEGQLRFLQQRCNEMATDIRNSIQQYQSGDSAGAQQFQQQ